MFEILKALLALQEAAKPYVLTWDFVDADPDDPTWDRKNLRIEIRDVSPEDVQFVRDMQAMFEPADDGGD